MSEFYLYGWFEMLYNIFCNFAIKFTLLDEVDGLMRICYNKLFKLLIDKNMKKKDLCEKAGISSSTIVKMGRQEPVSVELIGKICLALDCTADDVVEFFPDEPEAKS